MKRTAGADLCARLVVRRAGPDGAVERRPAGAIKRFYLDILRQYLALLKN